MNNVWSSKKYTRISKDDYVKPKAETGLNLQDRFLQTMVREKVTLDVFMKNESMRRGQILDYDNWTVLLKSDGKYYLLFKSAIMGMIPLSEVMAKKPPEPQRSMNTAYLAKIAENAAAGSRYGSSYM